MVWLLCIFLFLFIFFIVFLFSTMHVFVVYTHQNDDDHIRIKFQMWKWLSYSIVVPGVKIKPEDAAVQYTEKTDAAPNEKKKKAITPELVKIKWKEFENYVRHIQDFYPIIHSFCKKIKISQFRWISAIGLNDAAATAVAAGGLWGVKGNIAGLLNRFFQLIDEPDLYITPVFQKPYTQTRLSCMISVKIGHAMIVMLQLAKAWRTVRNKPQAKSKVMTGGTYYE